MLSWRQLEIEPYDVFLAFPHATPNTTRNPKIYNICFVGGKATVRFDAAICQWPLQRLRQSRSRNIAFQLLAENSPKLKQKGKQSAGETISARNSRRICLSGVPLSPVPNVRHRSTLHIHGSAIRSAALCVASCPSEGIRPNRRSARRWEHGLVPCACAAKAQIKCWHSTSHQMGWMKHYEC